jgi:NAD(P)H-hydrate repair Nnr-like enzyme with NAD(P)H-hydrate dehydratase domain
LDREDDSFNHNALLGGMAMGYDVHITKAVEWSESEKSPVTIEAWQKIIATDPSFTATNAAVATNPKTGEQIRIAGEAMAIWTEPKTQRRVYFHYRQGHIAVKKPDDAIIAKMKEVAKMLSARVIGDEGEEY